MHYIKGKDHKSEMRSSKNDLTDHTKSQLVIYGFRGGHTHTYPHESDYKKPCTCWPMPGVHLVLTIDKAGMPKTFFKTLFGLIMII